MFRREPEWESDEINAIQSAAADALGILKSRLAQPEALDELNLQSILARLQLAQMALTMPLASLGSCHCGHDLHYKGTEKQGLLVCCTGRPEHCWKIA